MTVAPLSFYPDTNQWKTINQFASVEDWRGTGGDSSDTGTLLAAIAAAKAAGGMQLRMPARHYTTEQTLLIDESHISLIGEGAGFTRSNLDSVQASARTSILWNGAVGGTIVKMTTPAGIERRLKGGLTGILLDGNSFRAARGLWIESWVGGHFFDVMSFACSESQFRTSVVQYQLLGTGGAVQPADTQRCLFEQCYASTTGSNLAAFLNSTAFGWHLTGGAPINPANTSGNVFIDCVGRTSKNLAWKLENADDNVFYWCNGDAVYDPDMYGLELGSEDQDSSVTPSGPATSRFNFFFGFGGKIIARSSQIGGVSSHGNMFFGYTRANNLPPPTVEEPAGGADAATVYYWDTTGHSRLFTLGMDEALLPPAVEARMAQLYVDGPAGPLKMLTSTGGIRQSLTASPAAFPNRDQAPALYSRFMDGIGTPGVVVGAPSVLFSDDFSAGLGTWTPVGTAPVIEAAPWGSGQSIKSVVNSDASVTNSYLSRPITIGKGRIVEFDMWLPQVVGLTPTSANKINNIMSLRPSGAYYVLGFSINPLQCIFQLTAYETGNTNPHTFTARAPLAANTKYHVKMEMYQGVDATIPGRILLSVNGVAAAEAPWSVPDHAMGAITQLWFGSHTSNTAQSFTVYLGNLTVSQMAADSLATRVTGSLNGINFVGGWATGAGGATPMSSLGLVDGAATPATVAGTASLYVGTAGGPLKKKDGTGTVVTVFDDQETGTWTPTFSFATPGDSVITYTIQGGYYQRMGQWVMIHMDLKFSTNAYTTATGNAQITGLPFTPSTGGTMNLSILERMTFAAGLLPRLHIPNGVNLIQIFMAASDALNTSAGIANFPASKTNIRLFATGLYRTAP